MLDPGFGRCGPEEAEEVAGDVLSLSMASAIRGWTLGTQREDLCQREKVVVASDGSIGAGLCLSKKGTVQFFLPTRMRITMNLEQVLEQEFQVTLNLSGWSAWPTFVI
jgi:hypothetical protein